MAVEQDLGTMVTEGAEAQLTAAIGAAPLSGAKLHLYKADFAPSKSSKAADLAAHEADFVGYAPAPVTYGPVGVDANGDPCSLSTRMLFQATDDTAPNLVGGCWLQGDTVGPPATHTAVAFYPFAVPVSFNEALQQIGVVLAVYTPQGIGYAVLDY